MSTEQWTSPTTLHPAVTLTANLAANGRKMGDPLIPSGYLYSAWQLSLPSGTASAPSNPGYIDLYAITTLDNSTYSVGDSGVTPPGQTFLCSFPLYPLANSGQIIHQVDVPLTPFRFVPMLDNKSGTTLPNGGCTVSVSFYNRQTL